MENDKNSNDPVVLQKFIDMILGDEFKYYFRRINIIQAIELGLSDVEFTKLSNEEKYKLITNMRYVSQENEEKK